MEVVNSEDVALVAMNCIICAGKQIPVLGEISAAVEVLLGRVEEAGEVDELVGSIMKHVERVIPSIERFRGMAVDESTSRLFKDLANVMLKTSKHIASWTNMSCCFKLIMSSGVRKKLLDDEKNIKDLLHLIKTAVAIDTESTVETPEKKKLVVSPSGRKLSSF
ncbi:hypothetical protein TrCOL_g9850 [Triparma columacea]|uniref:Uncharacterized protein n=1 Tax=Triparma columacea TaxID=722753 RepID=A0A9W7L7J7_9STRA|nr:hypothetical protein TrCOL_g9850 [Triparma columacea]